MEILRCFLYPCNDCGVLLYRGFCQAFSFLVVFACAKLGLSYRRMASCVFIVRVILGVFSDHFRRVVQVFPCGGPAIWALGGVFVVGFGFGVVCIFLVGVDRHFSAL